MDLSEIIELGNMKSTVDKAIKDAARDLAKMTESKIKELARQRLHSRFQMYTEGLSTEEVSEDIWVVKLASKVRWIEDGNEAFSMIDSMLKSPKAKTAKDGSKFLIVPFEHGKGKTAEGGASGSAQNDLNSTLKAEMKRRGIPFGKKEMNSDGSPKLGKLHSFDINKSPLKLHDGAGQGHGPVGEVRQGKTGTPFLEGVNIYQTAYKGKGGEDRVRKDIMTFRVVTSKQQGSGVWDHPGNDAMKFMEEGLEWARKEWETKISPEILDAIISKI